MKKKKPTSLLFFYDLWFLKNIRVHLLCAHIFLWKYAIQFVNMSRVKQKKEFWKEFAF